MWILIPLGGFVLGARSCRSWIVGTWVAFLLSALLACAIACGVALRRMRLRI
jgi:hypothetical protein